MALPVLAEALAKPMSRAQVGLIQGTPFRFILAELLDILRKHVERLEKKE